MAMQNISICFRYSGKEIKRDLNSELMLNPNSFSCTHIWNTQHNESVKRYINVLWNQCTIN